jgi:DNA modification methylase
MGIFEYQVLERRPMNDNIFEEELGGNILVGDCLLTLRRVPTSSIDCIVTSPPYWGQRDYDVVGQLGNEPTFSEYFGKLTVIFRECRRVLKDTGTLWVNLGDKYLPNKQLLGMPWRVAFALQEDGWILRQDIIWDKPNPMPESVTDRCTKSHEYIFMFAKTNNYFYDHNAIKEPISNPKSAGKVTVFGNKDPNSLRRDQGQLYILAATKNKRSVWRVATSTFHGAHFATFPEALIEPIIKAGCPKDGVVFDIFMGSGTTAVVAGRLGRRCLGIELNPDYAELANKRIDDAGSIEDIESSDDNECRKIATLEDFMNDECCATTQERVVISDHQKQVSNDNVDWNSIFKAMNI